MAKLVLTVVGDDRAGLVQSLADVVSAHGGNWETSALSELAGAFAGIVLVSVPDARSRELADALGGLDGMLRVAVHDGRAGPAAQQEGRAITFTVLGNDRAGIVRDVTAVLNRGGLTVRTFSSRTIEAPMAGGMLFEAEVVAIASGEADTDAVVRELEQLASEIQVDLTFAD